MRKYYPFVSIPLYFCLYYFAQNALLWYFSLFVFLPLILSFESDKKFILLKSVIVFICGFIYFSINFSWFSSFNNWAIPIYSSLASFFHMTVPYITFSLFLPRGVRSFRHALLLASIWSVFEYLLQYYPINFPYNSVSFILHRDMVLLQLLDLVGQFGLTFLIILINGLLYLVILGLIKNRRQQSMRILLSIGIIIAFWTAYGLIAAHIFKPEREIHIDLAQSSLLSLEKSKMDIESYKDLVDRFIDQRSAEADLIIFPETFFYSDISKMDNDLFEYLQSESIEKDISVSGGFIEESPDGPYYLANSFISINSDSTRTITRKRILAPFGEFYPLGSLFPSLRNFFETRRGSLFFNRGKERPNHILSDRKGEKWSFKTLICYESAYGSLLRRSGNSDTDFLVNVSSDLWTGSYRALIQNAIFSKYRAIEYRLPIVRVSNGGLSGYISSTGKAFLPLPAFTEGNAHIRLVKLNHPLVLGQSIYSLLGDYIVFLSFLYICFYVIIAVKKKIQSRTWNHTLYK